MWPEYATCHSPCSKLPSGRRRKKSWELQRATRPQRSNVKVARTGGPPHDSTACASAAQHSAAGKEAVVSKGRGVGAAGPWQWRSQCNMQPAECSQRVAAKARSASSNCSSRWPLVSFAATHAAVPSSPPRTTLTTMQPLRKVPPIHIRSAEVLEHSRCGSPFTSSHRKKRLGCSAGGKQGASAGR